MSFKKLVSDIKYNCEITNARFFSGERSIIKTINLVDLYKYEKGIRPYQKSPTIFRPTEDFEEFEEKKKDLWLELERMPYREIHLKPFALNVNGERVVYNKWQNEKYSSFVLGRYDEHQSLQGRKKHCDVVVIKELLATDIHFYRNRGLYYSDKWGRRILINAPYAEREMWESVSEKDEISRFLFKEILEYVAEGKSEKALKSQNYRSLLKKFIKLAKCHEIGHWMVHERYGKKYENLRVQNEEQKHASEILADTVPGSHYSTLNYILAHDDPAHPLLFDMYALYKQGHELKFLPELEDVWTHFPDKTSSRKLKSVIKSGFNRAKRILGL